MADLSVASLALGKQLNNVLSSHIEGAAGLIQELARRCAAGRIFVDSGGVLHPSMQVFEVKAYGAVGDGATDDTSAVQAALTAAALVGGPVYFPPGNYKITTALTLAPGSTLSVQVVGAGRGTTTITQATAATDVFQWGTTSAEACDACSIADLTLVPTRYGLNWNNCLLCTAERLTISGGVSGVFLQGQNERHVFRDLNLLSQTGRAFDAKGNLNGGGAGGPLNLPETQKCLWERIRFFNCTGTSAFDLSAGILGSQQVSGYGAMRQLLFESNNPTVADLRLGYVYNFSIDGMTNEDSLTTNNTVDGVVIDAGAGLIRLANLQLQGTINGHTYRYCVNQIDGGLHLLTSAFGSASGSGQVRLGGTGGVIEESSIISAANDLVVAGAAATGTRIVNLVDSTFAPILGQSGGSASISDGGTIAHSCFRTPTRASAVPASANIIAAVTAIDGTNLTVALKNRVDGSGAGATTVYWQAWTAYAA